MEDCTKITIYISPRQIVCLHCEEVVCSVERGESVPPHMSDVWYVVMGRVITSIDVSLWGEGSLSLP